MYILIRHKNRNRIIVTDTFSTSLDSKCDENSLANAIGGDYSVPQTLSWIWRPLGGGRESRKWEREMGQKVRGRKEKVGNMLRPHDPNFELCQRHWFRR